jgi:chemotaxis protein methyltransferase CheR
VNPGDFDVLSRLARERAGILIETAKASLMESRLDGLLRERGFPTIAALVDRLRSLPADGLADQVVDLMANHETSFFRDVLPFEALRQEILPGLVARGGPLGVWSAACSTGQEPYSLALLLAEAFPQLGERDVRIVASDFSQASLSRAREGIYDQLEVNRGLPAAHLVRWFERQGLGWRARPELRRRVEFRRINLLEEWSGLPRFDLVLLRNVLVYFGEETRRRVLGRVRAQMAPGGVLLLGTAESTRGIDDGFEVLFLGKTTAYRKTK